MASGSGAPGAEFSTRKLLTHAMFLGALLAWMAYRANRAFGDFLSDEGYLWYGVQRVLAGEVPLRDFMSYEIGRYYLAAALLAPFGAKGLLALRAALAVFAAVSVALGVGMVGHHWKESRLTRLLPVGLLLILWLVPRHKVFDIAISAVLVLAVYRLFLSPGPGRFFQLGVAVGVAAVMGQNHGFYGVLASLLAFGWLWRTDRAALVPVRFAWWAVGIFVGYLPVLGFALFVHGFLQAEWSVLHYLLVEFKGTNLPLPVPWPWRTFSRWSMEKLPLALESLFFLGLPVMLGWLAIGLWRRGRGAGVAHTAALPVAAWVVAVPYANVAFSRADIAHLAQAMLPFLLLGLATLVPRGAGGARRQLVPILLLLASAPVALLLHPRYTATRAVAGMRETTVMGDRLMLPRGTAALLEGLARVRPHGSVLAVPFFPGLAAALGERSPTWEIYPLFPRGRDFEQREIERIEAAPPAWVLLRRGGVDGRPDLSYPQTHPLTYRYIVEHYRRIRGGIAGLEAYRRAVGNQGELTPSD